MRLHIQVEIQILLRQQRQAKCSQSDKALYLLNAQTQEEKTRWPAGKQVNHSHFLVSLIFRTYTETLGTQG